MKLLVVAMLSMMNLVAVAQDDSKITAGDEFISQVKSAKIINVQPICPATAGGLKCMAYGSQITIEVPLSGCMDRFAGYTYTLAQTDQGVVINFMALEFKNKKSIVTRCIMQPVHRLTFGIAHEGKIRLNNLVFNGTNSEIAKALK